MRAEIIRKYTKEQTEGILTILKNNKEIYKCKTLELKWEDNKFQTSCIPEGTYLVIKRYSEKYGDHFHILDVPDRSFILIHHGNYYYNSKGCTLVGMKHIDINNDGLLDVTNSQKTMAELNAILPKKFYITIYSNKNT